MRFGLITRIEDYFLVMIDSLDVADTFRKHEELAKAELRLTVAHTNAVARELCIAAARTEATAQDSERFYLRRISRDS